MSEVQQALEAKQSFAMMTVHKTVCRQADNPTSMEHVSYIAKIMAWKCSDIDLHHSFIIILIKSI